MSEPSEYRVVDAPEDLAEPGSTNGSHPSGVSSGSGLATQGDETPSGPDTWGPNLPPLRLAAVDSPDEEAADAAPPTPPAPVDDPIASPPPWLRGARFIAGILLLICGWVATSALLLLGGLLLNGFPQEPSLPLRLGLYALTALAVTWLAVVALACVVAAAFALGLALTARGW
jgi:hypothetical protein